MRAEVKIKLPKQPIFDAAKAERQLSRALDLSLKEVERNYDATVSTWRQKPMFKRNENHSGNNWSGEVGTNDKIYGYIEEGVKGRIIRARRGHMLRFYPSWPKTIPRWLGSGPGGTYGKPIFRRMVRWPGIRARHFSEANAKDVEPKFQKNVNDALQGL